MQLVSIIVCTYNGSKYIEAQLNSILEQTYQNQEIIVVDDKSTDHTLALAEQIAKQHQNIKIIANTTNVGYIKNFERGIAIAKGDLISLSDQDDVWKPTKTETLVKNLENNQLVYCDSNFVDQNLQSKNESFSTVKNMLSTSNPLEFVIESCVSGHAMLFKKEVFEFASPFPALISHDWWLTYCATLQGSINYVDEGLVLYRHHDNNAILANKTNKTKTEKNELRRQRILQFFEKCPDSLSKEKAILKTLNDSYASFSIVNNFKRAVVFQQNRKSFLKILKKSTFKKSMLIFNMIFKIK